MLPHLPAAEGTGRSGVRCGCMMTFQIKMTHVKMGKSSACRMITLGCHAMDQTAASDSCDEQANRPAALEQGRGTGSAAG